MEKNLTCTGFQSGLSVRRLNLHHFRNPKLRRSAFRGASRSRPKTARGGFNIVDIRLPLTLNSDVVARGQLIQRSILPLRCQVPALGVSDTDQIVLDRKSVV